MALTLHALAETAPTGSIFLHAGRNPKSQIIKATEASPWSHLGLIVRPEDVGQEAGPPWLWESTDRTNLADARRGTHATGTQIVPLLDRIRSDQASGHVSRQAVRLYRGSLGPDAARALREGIEERSGIPFPTTVGLVAGYLLHLVDREGTPEMTVCTELAADSLQRMGWLTRETDPNGYGLSDFEPGGQVDADALGDASWGPLGAVEWVAGKRAA